MIRQLQNAEMFRGFILFRVAMKGYWKYTWRGFMWQFLHQVVFTAYALYTPLLLAAFNSGDMALVFLVIIGFRFGFLKIFGLLPDIKMHWHARVQLQQQVLNAQRETNLRHLIDLGFPFVSSVSPAITMQRGYDTPWRVVDMLDTLFWSITSNLWVMAITFATLLFVFPLDVAFTTCIIMLITIAVFAITTQRTTKLRRDLILKIADVDEELRDICTRIYEGLPTLLQCGSLEDQYQAAVKKHEELMELTKKDEGLMIAIPHGALRDIELAIGTTSLACVAVWWVDLGRISIEEFLLLVTLVGNVLDGMWSFSRILSELTRHSAHFKKMIEFLNHPSSLPVVENPKPLPRKPMDLTGSLEIYHIVHSLEKEGYESLEVPSFSAQLNIEAGEHIGIVGRTGAGKSTLRNGLAGLIPIQGNLVINDVPAADTSLRDLSSQCVVVDQNPIVFSGSMAENVICFRNSSSIDTQLIWEALDIAELGDFVRELPRQLDTIVGPNGINLSGGQVQRLAIARAMINYWVNPHVGLFILDEFTSSLDALTEQRITCKLMAELEGVTVIVIAHRLATVEGCDRIFVLEEGEIVEQGTKAELLSSSGIFSQMYAAQVTASH